MEYDKTNYNKYPQKGYYTLLTFRQNGFGLLKNSITGHYIINLEAYKYFKFSKRWLAGTGTSLQTSSNITQPFFLNKALGYEQTLRGYEYYVINGQHYVTGRVFAKFAIIPRHVLDIGLNKLKKFTKVHYSIYVNAFYDAGYVRNRFNDPSNTLANTFLYSGGIGIDLVAYYDKIIRFEYTMNRNKELGFFVNIGKAF